MLLLNPGPLETETEVVLGGLGDDAGRDHDVEGVVEAAPDVADEQSQVFIDDIFLCVFIDEFSEVDGVDLVVPPQKTHPHSRLPDDLVQQQAQMLYYQVGVGRNQLVDVLGDVLEVVVTR